MDQEKVRFNDASSEEVQRTFGEHDIDEAKPLLCALTNKKIEFEEKEAPTFSDKAVVNNEHINDAVKTNDVPVASSLGKNSGDLLARSDDPNDKTQIFNLERFNEEKVDVIDEGIDGYIPDSVVIKNVGEGEICSNSFKAIECKDDNSGIGVQKCFEKSEGRKQNLEQEIIIIDDNLDSDESETNVSKTSNDDFDQTKSSMHIDGQNIPDEEKLLLKTEQEVTIRNASGGSEKGSIFTASNASFVGDSAPKCSQDNIDDPKPDIKEHMKATSHPLEHGDNAIANKTEEEDIAIVQNVEVMEPKEKEETNQNHSEAEKASEERIKDLQRPRSRTYPFKVLVSGLPLGARREDVICYFSQFGEVLKLWDEGRHRANVLFADEESYKKAVCAPEPYFDDHKLLIRSINETVAVISGIPRTVPAKDVENVIRDMFEEAGALPCRIIVPLSDPAETSENNILQGHALIALNDPQTLQKVEERENKEPFVIADQAVKLHLSCNEFYEKFCIRVYPLPPEQPRVLLYHNIHATFESVGEIVAIMCQYVGNSSAYAGYVLFESEDSVKKAKEMEEIKILGEFVQVQEFHPFEQGQGFRHLWLKIHNLPPRVTITEIKHHFGHDRGILNIELDLDFGSCFMHVNSESAMQRCLRMHQTYLRGKCIAVMITEDHPDRAYFREISRRGRRPNFRSNTGRKKAVNNSSSNFNGKTFTSAAQPQGNQDRRGFERGDRKFSKSRSNNNHPKEVPKVVKEDGDGVKIADTPAV